MSDNALHTAAKAGNVAEVQSQVGKFDINAKGQWSETALFKAAEKGHTEVVKLLATHNADVNLPDVSYHPMISIHLI
jgi:VCBS repeat-containing protein